MFDHFSQATHAMPGAWLIELTANDLNRFFARKECLEAERSITMLAWKLGRFRDYFCLLSNFLKAFFFFYCGTLSAPRNHGLVFCYGSNVSISRKCSEVLWRTEVRKIFMLGKKRTDTFDMFQNVEFLLFPVCFSPQRTNL